MDFSYFAIFFIIVLNTTPKKVDTFTVYETQHIDRMIRAERSSEKYMWNIKLDERDEGMGTLFMDKEMVVFGSNKQNDTIYINNLIPNYQKIKWKKIDSLNVLETSFKIERVKNEMHIKIKSNEADEQVELVVNWVK